MLNKEEKKQEVGSISNSKVNQAGGNIVNNYNGLQAKDIVPLLKELVSFQISQYADDAKITAQKRFDDFGEKLTEEVTKKVIGEINRFNEPSIQLITREAALGYVKSGDDKQGEDLIDLLIERIKVDEHTTTQNIIDEAIKVIPTLSQNSLKLLILSAYRDLIFTGTRENYIKWLKSIDEVLKECEKINSIDIAYLQQTGCTYGVPALFPHEHYEKELLKGEDLFFCHEITGVQYDELLKIFGLIEVPERGIVGYKNINELVTINSVVLANPSKRTGTVNISSSYSLNEILKRTESQSIKDGILKAVKLGTPYTEKEVKQKLIEINPQWNFCIDLFNREDVMAVKPTILGYYIASRQLSKITGQHIGMDVFYKCKCPK